MIPIFVKVDLYVYLLHGSSGDEDSWVTSGRVSYIIDNLIAEDKIEPMIVVMPNGNPSKQAAPGETNENFEYHPELFDYVGLFSPGTPSGRLSNSLGLDLSKPANQNLEEKYIIQIEIV